ncbi:MAG: outer membrane protein transport protein [Bacteroidetes bacterium]|nr:outer membrane protein transport protein [Bacteroidota bacterium]
MRKITVFLLLTLAMGTLTTLAGGFQVSLHGQKQIGMGLIGTSLSQDASCLFYNPGGLGFMKQKMSFSGGTSFLKSFATFQKSGNSTYQVTTDNPLGTPFYLYGAYKINDKLGCGLAVNTPYGNKLKWGNQWAGRYLIEDISLAAIFIQPTVTYKIHPMISIGAGLVFATGTVDLNKALPITSANGSDGQVNIKGSSSSWGFNVGVMCQPLEKLSIGIDYRSEVKMKVDDGDAKFTVPSSLSTSFPADNKVSTTLPLPANLDIGASYDITDKLMVGFSLNYVFWDVYDSLIFDFQTNSASLQDSRNPREYKNKLIFRLGGQYRLNDIITVRLGGYYDPSPVNKDYFNPETPSLDITALSCGLSYYPLKKLSIDASFLYLMGKETDMTYSPDNFGGKYKTRFYIPGIGLTYSL